MTNQTLTPQQSFEKKLEDKIRDDIGELVPDEVLAELIKRSIDRVFFEPVKTVVSNGYHSNTTTMEPARFEQYVEEAMEPILRDAAEDWVAENAKQIREQINTVLVGNADRLVLNTLKTLMEPMIYASHDHLENRLQQIEQRAY